MNFFPQLPQSIIAQLKERSCEWPYVCLLFQMQESGRILVAMLENHMNDINTTCKKKCVIHLVLFTRNHHVPQYYIHTLASLRCMLLFHQIREDGPDPTFPSSGWVGGL